MSFFDFYHIFNVKDHLKYRERILNRIIDVGSRHLITVPNKIPISRSDWSNQGATAWYSFGLSKRDREKYEKSIRGKYRQQGKPVQVNSWFNQYDERSGSEHPMHDHPNVDLTNIYFVELEDVSLGTILKNPRTDKDMNIKVKEGQILTFPATIMHRSPPNLTDSRKTVISFNTRFL